MRTRMAAAVLGYVLLLVAAGLSIASAPEIAGCTTDSECMALCDRADVECDGGPQS